MIKSIPALTEYDTGEGVCRYLVNNLCAIYETRPEICNISTMYNSYYKSTMSEKEFVKINMESCERIALLFNDKPTLNKMKIFNSSMRMNSNQNKGNKNGENIKQ